MRLAIGRSMLADADLIVLDEPTNHVDVAGVKVCPKLIAPVKFFLPFASAHCFFSRNVVAGGSFVLLG